MVIFSVQTHYDLPLTVDIPDKIASSNENFQLGQIEFTDAEGRSSRRVL